ncbi:MAG: nucleotidyltransferase family protein, partial [Mesorhizobium sp.]
MHHLRYSGLPFEEQRAAFLEIVVADPLLAKTLARVRELALPDWLVVSGALYNSIWNHLTGRPSGYGIKDVDLFYFDGTDLSYEAEDAVIRRAAQHFEGLTLPVEVRNQARVHLWYPAKFGQACPRYTSASESVGYFASKTHAVGVRFDADEA